MRAARRSVRGHRESASDDLIRDVRERATARTAYAGALAMLMLVDRSAGTMLGVHLRGRGGDRECDRVRRLR